MSPTPIPRVLSVMRSHGVEALLMGGQACVLYGAAEFSRDADFAVSASENNLERLRAALEELDAEVVAVPPFERRFLDRGHAVHFRCHDPVVAGFRVHVMSRLRGVAPFPILWSRRTTWHVPDGLVVDSLSLPDLVASKKTQRDKDWPMIRRLVEANYDEGFASPAPAQVDFWLRELRTPMVLMEAAERFPEAAGPIARERIALAAAVTGDEEAVVAALADEEQRERKSDAEYWQPLRAELESLRRSTKGH